MAKASKDELKEQGAKLKEIITQARKKTLNFALLQGKDEMFLETHLKKQPAMLRKEAKSKGGGAKAALGVLNVEGKTLVFSVEDEPPGTFPKLLKKYFMARGLPVKVVFKLPSGQMMDDGESDGETAASPKGGGTPQQADGSPQISDPGNAKAEARWKGAVKKLAPHIQEVLKSGKGDPGKIRAVWAFATEKAEKKEFDSGLKALGPLAKLIAEARAQEKSEAEIEAGKGEGVDAVKERLKAQWEKEAAALGPMVKEMESEKGGDKLQQALGAAQGKADAGDFNAGLGILGRIKKALKSAPPKATPVPPSTPKPAPQPEEAKAVVEPASGPSAPKPEAAAPADLSTLDGVKADHQTITAQATGFGDKAPATWASELALMTKLLNVPVDITPEKLASVLKTATDALDKLKVAIAKTVAERTRWLKEKAVFEVRFDIIKRHPMHAEDPPIKGRIDDVTAKLVAAQGVADTLKYQDAINALTPLLVLCDEIEKLADDVAHYNAVFTDRVILVNPARGIRTGFAGVDGEFVKVVALFDEGVTKAAALDYEGAVAKLNAVPAAEKHAQMILDRAQTYTNAYANYDTEVKKLEAATADVRKLIAEPIKRLRKVYKAAAYAKTKDYVKSRALIYRNWGEVATVQKTMKFIADYLSERKTFKESLADLKKHKGRAGVEEYILLMERDLADAESNALAEKYAAAKSLLQASNPQLKAMQDRADACALYLDEKKAADKALAKIDKSKQVAEAASDLAQIDQFMQSAVTAATAKNYGLARRDLAQAVSRILVVQTLLANAKDMDKAKKSKTLSKAEKNFDKAHKAYLALRAVAASKDAGNDFTALLTAADTDAAAAKAASEASPQDNATMRAKLDAAVATVESVAIKVARKAGYDQDLARLEALNGTTLPPLNTDDCIKKSIDDITVLITDAKALATSAAFDIAGAEAKLGEGMRIGKRAQINGDIYKKIKPARVLVDAGVVFLKAPARAPAVTDEIARLEKLVVEADAKKLAEDFAGALAKTEEAKALIAPFKKIVVMYDRAIGHKKTNVTDRLAAITGKPVVAAELAEVQKLQIDLQKAFDTKAYEMADGITYTIKFVMDRADATIAAAADYEVERGKARTKLDALKLAKNKPVEEGYAAQEAVYKTATDFATAGNYYRAKLTVAPIPDACDKLTPLAVAYKAYEDARVIAETKLREATGHEKFEVIKPLLVRAKGKYDNGVKQAEADRIDEAKALMLEIPKDCTDALDAAKSNAELDAVGETVKGLDKADTDGIKDALAAAKTAFEAIKALPDAGFAEKQIKTIEAAFLKAEAAVATDPAAAIKLATAVITSCNAARIAIGHFAQLKRSADEGEAGVSALASSHAQKAYVKEDTDKLSARIVALLKAAMDSGDHKPGVAEMESVMEGLHAARALADAQVKYLAKVKELSDSLKVLEEHDHRYVIKAEIDAVRSSLQNAAGKVADRKHAEAMTLLEAGAIEGADGLLAAQMHANVPPDPKDIKALLARPGGEAEFDEMVKNLDPSTKRKVLSVAFEARYDCKLNIYASGTAVDAKGNMNGPMADDEAKGPNVARFYDIMKDLPDKDTKDNDSMLVFNTSDTGSGSSFNSKKKQVVMREGSESTSGAYQFGVEHQVGDVDEECKPKNDDPVDFFTWNTLHEVGHAVDDKHGFMKSKAKDEAYGGWIEFGMNVGPIAKAIAAEFEYDETYISYYMNYIDEPAIPEPKAGVEPEEWERRRIKARAYVDDAKVDRKPWSSASVASRLNIGGTVYHESYKYNWSGYAFSARSRGITGYQFRAPGEWFSEVYAAYKSDKLKDNHPAVKAWLKDL